MLETEINRETLSNSEGLIAKHSVVRFYIVVQNACESVSLVVCLSAVTLRVSCNSGDSESST